MYKFTMAGVGVFSRSLYPAGCVMMEYIGRVVRSSYFEQMADNFDYAMEMEYNGQCFVIDAWKEGNMARYVNHSCDPNMDMVTLQDGDKVGVYFRTKKAIMPGEELTVKYGRKDWSNTRAKMKPVPCCCRSG